MTAAPALHPVLLKDYRPFPWEVVSIDLVFSLGSVDSNGQSVTTVTSTLDIRPNPHAEQGDVLLQGEDITLESLACDGVPLLHISPQNGTIRLALEQKPHRLRIVSQCLPEKNTSLSGLYQTGGLFCTQCEAEGFRRITWFPDRPDVLSRFRVRIEAPLETCPILLSNGELKDSGLLPEGRHFALWEDPHPKPCYLFALVAGRLEWIEDFFLTHSGRSVRLRIYVEPGKTDRCAFAMASLKKAMAWDERVYGREYDLDLFMIVAVSDFNMGAMENKGLNIFNDRYILCSPETATDQDYANIESIIAHEYFHNWTGNRITCRDWFQLCLKEGLTVFRDQDFSIDQHLGEVQRILDVQNLRALQFPEDQGPLRHPVRPSSYVEINNFYTATVYEKGAELCRMLFSLFGSSLFFQAMDLYFERHDGQAVTIEDFVACFSAVSNRNLDSFFEWYVSPGTPRVTVVQAYDSQKEIFSLTLSQETSPPRLIPLKMALFDPETGEEHTQTLLEWETPSECFTFEGIKKRPILSINRGFTAPIHLETDHTFSDWLFLLHRDTDAFSRFEASQTLAYRFLTPDKKGASSQQERSRYFEAFQRVLEAFLDCPEHPALVALLLDLPRTEDLMWAIGHDADPDVLFFSRDTFKADRAQALAPLFETVYHHVQQDRKPYVFESHAWGQRRLKAMVLSQLAAQDPDLGEHLAFSLFETADNMSDTMTALNVLVSLKPPHHGKRDLALECFFDRYSHDSLLRDKWFALKAQNQSPHAAEDIRHLMMGHNAFSWTRPNTVRALIGTFCSQNTLGFHAKDGAGYHLLKEVILKLDSQNPQIASRLCGGFKAMPILDSHRKAICSDVLEEIRQTPGLSRDVGEMVSRLLSSSS